MKIKKHLKKKGDVSVGMGIKVITAVVCGALVLMGLYTVVKDVVLPKTNNKVTSAFNYASSLGNNEQSGGQTPGQAVEPVIPQSSYTNQIPLSTDETGAVYNGTGYKDGYRLNSGAAETASSGSIITGFIPVKAGDVVRFSGEYICDQLGAENTYFYDNNKSNYSHRMTPFMWAQDSASEFTPANYDSTEHKLYSFTVPDDANIAYVRFSLHGTTGADAVITVNEEIN